MLERVLIIALLCGMTGALQTAAWAGLNSSRVYLALITAALQMLAVGAVTALAAPVRTRWLNQMAMAALVGLFGQGLACIYVGAPPILLLPASLGTLLGAVLYRALVPLPSVVEEEESYA